MMAAQIVRKTLALKMMLVYDNDSSSGASSTYENYLDYGSD